ncbi:hypothetical protein TWF730_009798 [Orbilia blumenaviensis]|uniref:Uncharacterized protein n=1 Tax=Orbilia blumenaviensis TaxID=1796055 RepID=A0AAV9UWA2_9PEZI
MASKKNRGVYRARGLHPDTTEDEFRDVLMGALTPDEKGTMSIRKLSLAPSPINNGRTQVAIFRFQGGTPAFLDLDKKDETHIQDKRGAHVQIDANFWGLTQLYPAGDRILVDVVALTGLNAHAYGSWSGATNDETNPMWLQDYLATEPGLGSHCRSMVYGYNAKTEANASHDTNDYVKGFLAELLKARSRPEEENRPLVLLGHSYGGLIIAYAFTRAYWDSRYESIYNSTIRILCFGVPYRGIKLEDVEKQVNSDKKRFHQGVELLKGIFYEAATITPNTELFSHLLHKTNTRLITFYETLHTREVKEVEGKFSRSGEYIVVVSKDSAILGLGGGLEEHYDTDGDHSTIVKFTSQENRTYTTIVSLLKKLLPHLGEDEVKIRTAKHRRERGEERQAEFAKAVSSIENPQVAKYVSSQMLRLAADTGQDKLAKELLEKGADPNMQAHKPEYKRWIDRNWFFDCGRAPDGEEDTDKYQIDVAQLLQSDVTALALATKRGHAGIVKILLDAHADPNIPCSSYLEGRTPLHEACKQGRSEIVQHLLMANANVNAKAGEYGTTPLHEIAYYGSGAAAPKLLTWRTKPDINAKKLHTGDTALHIAAQRNNIGLVYDLIQSGANATVQNNFGNTALHIAAEEGHNLVVSVLLTKDKGRIIDIQNSEGETALHKAVDYGNIDIVERLLEEKANKDLRSNKGLTAARLAEVLKESKMVALLTKS